MHSSKLKRFREQIRGPHPCEPRATSICDIRASSRCRPAASAHGRIDDSYGSEGMRAPRLKRWPSRDPATATGQKRYGLVKSKHLASPSPFLKGSDAPEAAD